MHASLAVRSAPLGRGLRAVKRADPATVVLAGIAFAWLTILAAQAGGSAALLHHHALLEGGPPLWIALPAFLVGWAVMVVAMMLPASLPALLTAFEAMAGRSRPRLARASFVGAFILAWTGFGLIAFVGDLVLHRVVDATPWLAARPWLIEAAVLALAGAYQFAPLKQRGLAACRHAADLAWTRDTSDGGGFALGLAHARVCLASSWALMLLLFAGGFADVWPMVALTALMVYETTGRHGQRVAALAGILLLFAGLVVLSGPLAPR